jgi:hypothetical protein
VEVTEATPQSSMRAPHGGFAGRWKLAIWAASVACCMASAFVLEGWTRRVGLLVFFLLVVLVPTAGVLAIVCVVRLWWRPRDALVALVLLCVFALVVSRSDDLVLFGRRVHVRTVAAGHEAEARRLFAHPPEPVLTPSIGDRLVLQSQGRSGAVVVWVEAEGIPFRSYGLVYDPHDLLADGSTDTVSDGTTTLSRWNCDDLEQHWLWCRVY